MRIRASLILDETLLAKIDEIAGEKTRRAATIETALREYIAREEKKRPKTVAADETAAPGRSGSPRPAAKPVAKPAPKPAARPEARKAAASKPAARAKR